LDPNFFPSNLNKKKFKQSADVDKIFHIFHPTQRPFCGLIKCKFYFEKMKGLEKTWLVTENQAPEFAEGKQWVGVFAKKPTTSFQSVMCSTENHKMFNIFISTSDRSKKRALDGGKGESVAGRKIQLVLFS